ncbi:MAG TPA: HAMP domain-containing sensor histidine kinase [Candidatus Saccharimonadales bacterium]|jgi:two-component system nitrogen regulation sensor histidine kinase NtrY|nr:HAMP domain-containing sensor histidine kinase [Candidatus Saccharimonadales bacterium]
MSFRAKVFLIFLVTVLASVSVVAYGVVHYTQAAFEEMDAQRTEALVSQFNKEFEQRRKDVAQQVENVASGEITLRAAMDLARPNADQSLYVHDAIGVSQDHGMDFVEFVNWDGTIISSAQYPGRVGYKNDWVTATKDWRGTAAFLKREELPDGVALAVTAVRTVSGGNDKNLYIIGGWRLDQNFLAALSLPTGMRALLYRNLEPTFVSAALTDVNGTTDDPDGFRPLIEQIQKRPQEVIQTIRWKADAASAETFHAMPLLGRNNDALAVLLVGSSRKELVLLTRRIVTIAAAAAGAAILVGLFVSLWVAARITRPVEQLAEGAREVATGRWDTRIDVRGTDEIGQLGTAFNDMTRTLAVQKEKLVQTERVAAWRELARRLAHELRNPLFPMQITLENMQRAKQLEAKQFLEVFNESTATLKTELANLNTIVGRFSDFSKMPTPQFTKVNVNEALRAAVRLFEAQFNAVGKPTITTEFFLTEPLPEIDADADLLHKAFQNLVLNALDAMPAGGTLTLRTFERERNIRVDVADTGKGLTPEECSRLFTPYYTTKQQGTGLGLAIVQAVVSDHQGTISVTSDEGRGTSFKIDLPQRQAGARPAPAQDASPASPSTKTLAAASD